jgi:hypothetical protein
VFEVIDSPSHINALDMSENPDPKERGLGIENVKGKIVFEDVWFRYP